MLAIHLGDARGAERERALLLAEAMPRARVVDAVGPEATVLLQAGAGPVAGTPPGLPTIAWVTVPVLAGRAPWPRADALLVPSTSALDAAIAQGRRRSGVHVVPHPVRVQPGPAFRTGTRPGSVGVVAAPSALPGLCRMLARLPRVCEVRPLTAMPGEASGPVPSGDGVEAVDGIDGLALVLLAAVSSSGALPAHLMERGVPLIAWDDGAAADLIVDGLCGWLVQPSLPAMASAVQAVLADRWARESAGIAARDRILACSSPQAAAAAVGAVLHEVSKRHPRVGQGGAADAG